ncbi:MAG: dockerin type I repeat-containing protein, partial [Ruminococcus sp.]
NEGDETMVPKYNYIKETYQKLEDALYNGTMADLEEICDINSLATMYLLQDFGKNCDGGYTSTFFTYNAEEKKFYASPLWDCDSMLGAVDCVRDGCSTSTCDYRGWTTRLATYKKTVNPYGKAFTTSGTTSEGKTFEDVCKEIWTDKFLPAINILLKGGTSNNGKLKSIKEYAEGIQKASYNNYVKWNFFWYCIDNNSGLSTRYSYDYNGELQYLCDWTEARANWITAYYNGEPITTPTNPTTPTEPDTETDYFIQGDGFGGWSVKNKNYQLKDNGDGTYYIDLTFKADTYYKFKIVDDENNYYDPDLTDETTLKYVHQEGNHNNAGCTPTEDTKVTITLNLSNNMFYVAYYELGDVNEDLLVDINDATAIQRYLVDSVKFSNRAKANADFNENGVVDIRDVTSIQKSLLKFEEVEYS